MFDWQVIFCIAVWEIWSCTHTVLNAKRVGVQTVPRWARDHIVCRCHRHGSNSHFTIIIHGYLRPMGWVSWASCRKLSPWPCTHNPTIHPPPLTLAGSVSERPICLVLAPAHGHDIPFEGSPACWLQGEACDILSCYAILNAIQHLHKQSGQLLERVHVPCQVLYKPCYVDMNIKAFGCMDIY